jgi:uncharacterized integral membrane protein
MRELWLKIKVWTKIIFFALLLIYILIFVMENSGQPPVQFWYWFKPRLQSPFLLFILMTFLAGIVVSILFRPIRRTLLQLRQLYAPKPEKPQPPPPITAQPPVEQKSPPPVSTP